VILNPKYPQPTNIKDCGVYTMLHMQIYEGKTKEHPVIKGDKTSGKPYILNGLNDNETEKVYQYMSTLMLRTVYALKNLFVL